MRPLARWKQAGSLYYGSIGQALWLRYLNSSSVQQLPGTEGIERIDDIAWSPDSRYLLFVVNGKLKKRIPRAGFLKLYVTSGECPWRLGGRMRRCCFPAHFLAMPL
jgi:hypothetical protein